MHTSILTQPSLEQSCPFFTQTDSRLVNVLFSAPWTTVKSFPYLGGNRPVCPAAFVLTEHSGYGYQVCIVEDLQRLDYELAAALQWAVGEIRTIQTAARSGRPLVKPRWPMIVLRTPKVRSPPVCGGLLYPTVDRVCRGPSSWMAHRSKDHTKHTKSRLLRLRPCPNSSIFSNSGWNRILRPIYSALKPVY